MPSNDALAKQNARTLAVAAMFGGASPAIVISLGGLVGQSLAPDKALATPPSAFCISAWRPARFRRRS